MKKLVFVFFALFFATIITGCNARENTVRFDTNIVDDEASDSTTEETTDEDSDTNSEEESADETSDTDEDTDTEIVTMDPVENTDNLPYVGSSAWLAFLISVSISGSYVLVQKLKKSSL